MSQLSSEKSYQRFESFKKFYPYYLSEHSKPMCRAMHYIGSSLVLLCLLMITYWQSWQYLILLPLIGYGFAWIGHGLFEHNRPATFRYPIYSFMGDWVMFYQFITRAESLNQ